MKKKTSGMKSLFETRRAVPERPEGYYSGDKPNPNLQAFVEQHIKENPYDPEKDKYDVPAFDKYIESTKATAIYNMHTYWSKKPHDAIAGVRQPQPTRSIPRSFSAHDAWRR